MNGTAEKAVNSENAANFTTKSLFGAWRLL